MRQNWTIWTNYSLKSRWLEGPKVAPKLLPNEEEPCYSMSNCSKKCARTPIYLLLTTVMAGQESALVLLAMMSLYVSSETVIQ